MVTPRPSGASLAHRLEAEWESLVSSPAADRALAGWARLEPALSGWPDLQQLRAACHHPDDPATSDAILSALVRLAAVDGQGDVLASRVVLQLLVPGALRLVRTLTPRNGGDVAATEAAVFAELVVLIRTYPWQRRPRRTAANLLLDCRQRLSRSLQRTHREQLVGLVPAQAETACTIDEDAVAVDHLLWWACRHGVLDGWEAELLFACHVAGIPMQRLQVRYGRKRSSLFADRAAAEQRLRRALRDA